jgi:hypothetical protein
MSHKPEGHNSVSPYLIVREPEKVIEFLETVFGGELILEHHRSDGFRGGFIGPCGNSWWVGTQNSEAQ